LTSEKRAQVTPTYRFEAEGSARARRRKLLIIGTGALVGIVMLASAVSIAFLEFEEFVDSPSEQQYIDRNHSGGKKEVGREFQDGYFDDDNH
jgi:hypothetical protein